MTLVIDIEARNNPRYASPQASFRRTEADRRPSTVVPRPNDGPGDMRAQYARELAARLAGPPSGDSKPPTQRYEDKIKQRRNDTTERLLKFIALNPEGCNGRQCVAFIMTRPDYVNMILVDLEGQSLITRRTYGVGSAVLNTITDTGRAYLKGLSA